MVVFPFSLPQKAKPPGPCGAGGFWCLVGFLLFQPFVHAKAPGWHHDHQDKLHKDHNHVEIHEIDIPF
jgi:hypothetical protein|tara:strand:- start:2464 stop:2667 length:204 start_codon:yes stop_codon:yes gene_type:complete